VHYSSGGRCDYTHVFFPFVCGSCCGDGKSSARKALHRIFRFIAHSLSPTDGPKTKVKCVTCFNLTLTTLSNEENNNAALQNMVNQSGKYFLIFTSNARRCVSLDPRVNATESSAIIFF
jgi:hypothetical protein